MGKIPGGDAFGLDKNEIKKIDWELALKRVIHDLRSDFIYAPHLSFIYSRAGMELIEALKTELRDGRFHAGLPLTIEVPKSQRVRVLTSSRLGPNYSRPGSILPPKDRILYQALADQATPIIAAKTDPTRSFSHKLAPPGSANMFLPTRTCWNDLQKALKQYSALAGVNYVLKVDVANYFGSLNLHTMINVLNDSGYSKSLSSRLEALFTTYSGERSSRGILQGVYPSDLFGNFYLSPIDRLLDEELQVPSARYVDDIYIFIEHVDTADHVLRQIIPALRSYDLVLNEAKSVLMPKAALNTEEPDLETLFNEAVDEIAGQINDETFDADYGFQSEWRDEDEEEHELSEEELELQATTQLFDSMSLFPGQEENIERFCLPLFWKSRSAHALEHVMASFGKRPAMSQIYAAYLASFLNETGVSQFLLEKLKDAALVDWQRMWLLAALLQSARSDDATVKAALDILKDPSRHDSLRAVAAIFVGRFGDHARRKNLITLYKSTSTYVQAAIYFSSRQWPTAERGTAKASWSGHSELHRLIAAGIQNQSS